MAYVWAKSTKSGQAITRSGQILIDKRATQEQRLEAMEILSEWRASHAYPLHAIYIFLRKKSTSIEKASLVVRRLKRTPSIITKLSRFPSMKLSRMQDIGGCRSIVSNVKQVERLLEKIKRSKTSHEIHNVKNYIDEPKDTGYRGVHIVFKYNASKPDYKGYFIEAQLRSKIQHAWATAVEIVDTYTKQALKSSGGEEEWRKFFVYASAEFAKLEDRPVGAHVEGINTKEELKKSLEALNVIKKLRAYSASSNFLASRESAEFSYFLLTISHSGEDVSIEVEGYRLSELAVANQKYLELESNIDGNSQRDVVLVSATSLKDLRKAYPNYYADSKEFVKHINQSIA